MTTIAPVELDDSILEDTLRCTGGHTGCSVHATHRIVYCQPSIPVCHSYVHRHLKRAVEKGFMCADCGSRIADCWKAVPV